MKKGHGLLTHIVNVLVFVSLFLITANTGFPQLKDMIKKTEQGIKDVGKQTKTNVDAEKLAFEADKELNAAQRDMFSGKKDQAVEGLLKAAQKIADVKSLNPDHPKLNILESKRDKLRGDLEKRVGKKIPLPSDPKDNQTTPAPEKAAPLTPAPAQIKPEASQKENLPHDARVIMEKIERDLTNLEYDLNLIPNQREDIKKSYLNRMPDKFKEVEMAIPEAKTKAAEKGITQHPSFERAEKRLMENKGRFEEMKKQADQAAQTAAAKASEVETDVDALFKVYEPLKNNVFPKAPGSVIYYNDLNPVKECLGVIENFEKNDMNKVKKAYDDFSAKYGSTKEDVDAKMKELGY
ncbi:MAG: hypothetical protein NT106_14565, partial [Candidatus Sumerlaeota bacterium]|nr:hypothetical protein [Candidatus Sumerlaeota bacterium]